MHDKNDLVKEKESTPRSHKWALSYRRLRSLNNTTRNDDDDDGGGNNNNNNYYYYYHRVELSKVTPPHAFNSEGEYYYIHYLLLNCTVT